MDQSISTTSKTLTEKLCQLKTLTQNLSCKASLLVLPAVFFAPSAHLPKDNSSEKSTQGLPCCKVESLKVQKIQKEQNKKESVLSKLTNKLENNKLEKLEVNSHTKRQEPGSLEASYFASNSSATDFSNKLTNTQSVSYLIHLPPTQEIRFSQVAPFESSIEIKQTQFLVPTLHSLNSVDSTERLTEPATLGASLEISEETIFAYLLGAFFLASFFCIYLGARLTTGFSYIFHTAYQYKNNQNFYKVRFYAFMEKSQRALYDIVKKSKNMRYLHSLSHASVQQQAYFFHTA